jgi:hypothetical protein
MKRLLAVMAFVAAVVMITGGRANADSRPAPIAPGPMPANMPPAPPPIQLFPAAGTTSPSPDVIADPVTPTASCVGWYLQGSYGNRWAAGSSWWEYQCTSSNAQYHNLCPGPACDAYCPYCSWETWQWTDYFYWDGSTAVFVGEVYSDTVVYDYQAYDNSLPFSSSFWWDGPTAQWYNLGPYALAVSVQGTGSGEVSSSPAGISCGYYCDAAFDAGVVVTLTAVPDAGSSLAGWSGDCSGTSTCQLTVSRARSVTATFTPGAYTLAVTRQGTGTGLVSASLAGLSCGAACEASFAAGSAVTLTASPDPGSVFAGWSGDCSGSGSCQLTMGAARSASATFAPNLPPSASFTLSCTGLSCNFDAGNSSDLDDPIATYSWSFGDGGSGSGPTVSHTYPKPGTDTVSLTVTDDAGAGATTSQTFNPIMVSARGYKQSGTDKVDLSWNGPSGTSYEVFRDSTRIATPQATSYTDTLSRSGTATDSYRVCGPAASICSKSVSVSF